MALISYDLPLERSHDYFRGKVVTRFTEAGKYQIISHKQINVYTQLINSEINILFVPKKNYFVVLMKENLHVYRSIVRMDIGRRVLIGQGSVLDAVPLSDVVLGPQGANTAQRYSAPMELQV
jgi:hypothetical protein